MDERNPSRFIRDDALLYEIQDGTQSARARTGYGRQLIEKKLNAIRDGVRFLAKRKI
jgi:hypothetical protein